MTREDALNKWVLPALQRTWNEKKVEEILKALEQEPDAIHNEREQEYMKGYEDASKRYRKEPCEDCISRAEVLKAIDTYDKFGCDANTKLVPYQDYYVPYIHYYDVVNCIKGMPPVTPQPKTGHWIEKDGYDGDTYYDCSVCGESWTTIDGDPWDNGMNYCPHCGAKMAESEE